MHQTSNADLVEYKTVDSTESKDPKLAMEAQRTATTRAGIHVHLVLLVLQVGYAGHQVLSRVALTNGLSQFVYTIYRNGIALVLMAPFAYVLEKKKRPPITPRLLFNFFVLSLAGIVGSQQLFLPGLIYTSATFAATMQNACPMFTFLLGLMFGIEKVRLRRLDGKEKIVGTVACVLGAVLMSVWQGPAMIEGWNEEDLEENDVGLTNLLCHTLGSHALRLGIDTSQLCLLANWMSWAAYFIMLGPVLEVCPAPLTITSWMYFFGSLQVGVLMLLFTGGNVSWSLDWGPQFASVAYAGVISSGVNFSLQSWAIQRGGPLLVSIYTPLQVVIVAILSVLLLGDWYYLGSLLEGIRSVAGLYLVTWGQVEHRKQAALAVGVACGDVESASEDPQSQYSSPASCLTTSLLAE